MTPIKWSLFVLLFTTVYCKSINKQSVNSSIAITKHRMPTPSTSGTSGSYNYDVCCTTCNYCSDSDCCGYSYSTNKCYYCTSQGKCSSIFIWKSIFLKLRNVKLSEFFRFDLLWLGFWFEYIGLLFCWLWMLLWLLEQYCSIYLCSSWYLHL